jgi:hypothetical protein
MRAGGFLRSRRVETCLGLSDVGYWYWGVDIGCGVLSVDVCQELIAGESVTELVSGESREKDGLQYHIHIV